VTGTAVVIFWMSCTTAIVHALIPDHWLPFVLLARNQGWSRRRLTILVALAGLLHVSVSIILALVAIVVGRVLDFPAGWFLVIFGIAYGLLAHLRERRAHRAPAAAPGAPGDHVHAHGHLLERWFHGALSGPGLVAVIGISPCALLVPVLFAASSTGAVAMFAAALGFVACTLATMVGVALFAHHGMRRFDLPLFARYGDLASGALIAAIGLLVLRFEG
jgi:nickel/cobalt exporter